VYRVVETIEANWDLLKAFYGPSRMRVTVTATGHGGYRHAAPNTVYETMTAADARYAYQAQHPPGHPERNPLG
jgi:hypothetical protein